MAMDIFEQVRFVGESFSADGKDSITDMKTRGFCGLIREIDGPIAGRKRAVGNGSAV
jgi:hypothetical protein